MNKINIVLSPSQQAANKCASGDSEKDHMRAIGEQVFEILSTDNRLNVFLIPYQGDKFTTNQRLSKAVIASNKFIKENGGVGFHLALHSDAMDGKSGHGASLFYLGETGKAWGRPIWDEICRLTPWPDMSFSKRTDLYELNKTTASATLLEVSFHDKQNEAAWVHGSIVAISQAICLGIYRGIGLAIPKA